VVSGNPERPLVRVVRGVSDEDAGLSLLPALGLSFSR
jgi:hypothetical protein